MDGPAISVPPVEGKDVRQFNNRVGDVASFPPQALPLVSDETEPQQAFHEVSVDKKNKNERHRSPLKEIVNPDSLYKYTNWEDPVRTIGSYVGIMSILLGAHYLPLTQTALKFGATALGVAATVEYAHRSFTPNTILARLRPKEYKKIPEPVLNDTLKDIHDLVQYLVVEAQKIILGQDLERTFAGFISLSALYWLVKMVSPFALVLLSVTMLYIAPLVRTSRGREVIEDAKVRATDLGNAALENSQALANDGRAKAAELSNKAQETAAETKRRVEELAQKGTQSAADTSAQVKDKASDMTGAAVENANALPQLARNTLNNATNTASVLGAGNQQTQSTSSNNFDDVSHKNANSKDTFGAKQSPIGNLADTSTNSSKTTTDDANERMSRGAASAKEALPFEASAGPVPGFNTSSQMSSTVDAGDSHYALKSTSSGLKDTIDSTPRQLGGITSTPLNNTMAGVASESDQAGTQGIMGRPRGVPLADLDGAPGFGKHLDTEI